MELCCLCSLLLPGLAALLLLYLGFIRRCTASTRAGFTRREAGRWVQTRLQDTLTPRLSGIPFQIFAYLTNTVFGQYCLVPLAMRLNHLDLFRYLFIPEDPTFLPLVPPEDGNGSVTDDSALEILQEMMATRLHFEREDFTFYGIQDFINAYWAGIVTPTHVAMNILRALEDCEQSNPPLRAMTQWDKEEILKMAEASAARYKDMKPLSPLDGIPVCLKEEIKVVPYLHKAGTAYLGTEPETEDATVTRKLREAGALIIGVSNMHELGTGTTGCNPNRFHGTTRNPYNPQHYTGGSSSGSAAAVAAGLCPLAIGTDGGGSVRIPSSFCGVVGLKSTFGRISAHGALPLSYSTVSFGPLCTSVLDSALAYTMLSGVDPAYPYGLKQPPITLDGLYKSDLKDLTLGVDWTFFKACDPEILEICQKAVEYLKSQGASIMDISIPELEEVHVAHIICILGEMRDFLQQDFNEHFHDLNLETRASLALGCQFTALDYIQANRQRTRTMNYLHEIFTKVNCILTPGTACTAPSIQDSDLAHGFSDVLTMARSMRFMQLGNFTGIPGLVVPAGYNSSGLPVSLQIMAKWWDEEVLFRVGMMVEEFRNYTKKPKIYYDIIY
ncbi:hypothetical protein NDU88_000877 [Pleurodeles waltl]|uniref:Amidase domain-containing protein n=1 Tax=Pleurodeles waltl TaxID=8319 RepID=A0AAV7NAU4_PLEWA|nr:hypothetical protein NDU88_000877 [Pleurodeles waltl]